MREILSKYPMLPDDEFYNLRGTVSRRTLVRMMVLFPESWWTR